ISIQISVFPNPRERQLDVRPEAPNKLKVSGPFIIGSCQDDEQRRDVDASIVQSKWNFFEGHHFPLPRFVKNLAGLRISLWIIDAELMSGQITEHPLGQ